MESMWSVALVIKSIVVSAAEADCFHLSTLLHHRQFVDSVSFLAQLGTGLSRKWNVKDLEVTASVFVAKYRNRYLSHKFLSVSK